MYQQEFKVTRNRNGVWLISAEKEFTKRVWAAHTVPGRAGKSGSVTTQLCPQSDHRTGMARMLLPPPKATTMATAD